VLLITHRLHLLEPQDDTLALEAGRIVARGKAQEVLRDWL
jgi:ABC-type bacteriocin/lantibiotic exporter with double-glycine peptidase domain